MIKFLISDIAPLSTNQSVNFNKKGRYFKSTKKNDYQKRIDKELIKHRAEIFDFQASYSPYEHFLVGTLYVFTPRKKLITKKECVSKTSFDVNNHKVFTDAIFKHFDELDDAMLISEPPFKLISPDDKFHMGYILEIYDLEQLDDWSKCAWKRTNE